MSYEKEQLQHIIEGAILAAGEPLTLDRMLTLFEENEAPSKEELLAVIDAVKQSCEGRGFLLTEVASGYRFQVREDLAGWINRLWEEKPQKYSRAMLETLALIAYRQPITRGDIEEVRGVAVSSHIIKTLSEREWVKVVGHRDVPGRPALYATTKQFLNYFNLKSLDELPTLGELRDIDSLNESLEFDSLPPEVQESLVAAVDAPQSTQESNAQQEFPDSDDTDANDGLEIPVPDEHTTSSEDPADSDNLEAESLFDSPEREEINSLEREEINSLEPDKIESPEPEEKNSPEREEIDSPEPEEIDSPEPEEIDSSELDQHKSPEPEQNDGPELDEVNMPEIDQIENPESAQIDSSESEAKNSLELEKTESSAPEQIDNATDSVGEPLEAASKEVEEQRND